MAIRDSRGSRRKLALFAATITLGVAALVATVSFGDNLSKGVNLHSKSLVGADLIVTTRRPFSEEQTKHLQSIGGTQKKGMSFSAMVSDPRNGRTRLVQIRAVEDGFPFYGGMETTPDAAASSYQSHRGVLVEQNLMMQFGTAPGDRLKIGEWEAEITGTLLRVPGATLGFSAFAPRIFIPYSMLEATGLVQERSLLRYQRFYRFPEGHDMSAMMTELRPWLQENQMSHDTVEKKKDDLGESMGHLYQFLNLGALAALLLGAVAIASAVHAQAQQKRTTSAILRCIGASKDEALAICLIQSAALALLGTLAGVPLGIGLLKALPMVAGDFVPFEVETRISWFALLQATSTSFFIACIFAVGPYLPLRNISPLAAMRADVDTTPIASRRSRALFWLCAWSVVTFATITLSENWKVGLGIAAGIGGAFGCLGLCSLLVLRVARLFRRIRLSFAWRQGFANLHRPNNRTGLVITSIGLGSFMMLSVFLTHHALLSRLFPEQGSTRPNAILFEVQTDQKEEVVGLLKEHGLPIMQEASIVNMRLGKVKGVEVGELLNRKDNDRPDWVLRREYRSTWRSEISDSETLVAGAWAPTFDGDLEKDAVPVSVEEEIASDLGVTLGDELVFDVQGIPIRTKVSSLRRVDWRRIQPNFFVVFPTGVLEDAPSMHIIATRVAGAAQSATMQQAVVSRFPNVSVADITLIIETLDNILSRVSFAIRFMAMFIVGTGLMVLWASVLSTRFQRVRENVMLRTLGASSAQIRTMLFAEYAMLGLLSAAVGCGLSVLGSWALARFAFEMEYALDTTSLLTAATRIWSLVIIAGLAANRGVCSAPPLESLRQES